MSIKFSELPEVSTLTDADIIALVQNGTSDKAKLQALATYILAKLSSSHPSINTVENAGDYVVRKLTNNGWYVRYWNSGRFEAWRTVSRSTDSSSFHKITGNYGWLTRGLADISPPSTALTITQAFATVNQDGLGAPWWSVTFRSVTPSAINAILVAPVWQESGISGTIQISYYIAGTYDRSIFS